MEKKMANDSDSSAATTAEVAGAETENTQEKVQDRPLRAAAKSKYPDFAPEDDAEWNEKEDEVFNEMSEYNKSYKDAEGKLDEIISTDEELAGVLNDMIVNKTPFRVAIAKYYSSEDLIPVEGDEDFEAYQKAYDERVSKKSARDARDVEISNNEKASLDAIDKFAEEKSMDEEQKTSFIEFINNIFNDMLYKKLTPETLTAFYGAMNHDGDVAKAAEAGEIKGRNASIEAAIEEEDKKESGDGLPQTDKGAPVEPDDVDSKSMLDDIISTRRKF